MSRVKTFVISTMVALFIGFVFISSSNHPESEPIPGAQKTTQHYVIKSLALPEEVNFAGEAIPLENFDTKESFDRELLVNTYWQSQTILFIKRAHKYFPIIEPILKEHGIPDDFKYLALAESGLMNVSSPAGAKGYWQILKGTAKDYGLEVNSEVDERYHLEKATIAAAKILNKDYKKFGSWSLTAAAYNMGRTNIIRQVKRQKSNNYHDLMLGEETGRYVYRIAAIKTILEAPEAYGFYVNKKHLYHYPKYTEVTIDSTISSLADYAHDLGINYKTLKELNPWLRDNTLTNASKKTYTIKVAKAKERDILSNHDFFPMDTLPSPEE